MRWNCRWMQMILSLGAILVGVVAPKTEIAADEKNGCHVDKNGTIVCEEDIPEGCWINPETLEVECSTAPCFNHDDEQVRK